jgi:hypothetical protein
VDHRQVHALGTASLAAGAALAPLALSLVVVGGVAVADGTASPVRAFEALAGPFPATYGTLDGSERTLYLGVVGVGASLWLLGVGFVLHGRTER